MIAILGPVRELERLVQLARSAQYGRDTFAAFNAGGHCRGLEHDSLVEILGKAAFTLIPEGLGPSAPRVGRSRLRGYGRDEVRYDLCDELRILHMRPASGIETTEPLRKRDAISFAICGVAKESASPVASSVGPSKVLGPLPSATPSFQAATSCSVVLRFTLRPSPANNSIASALASGAIAC